MACVFSAQSVRRDIPQPLLVPQQGPTSAVDSVAISADGKMALTDGGMAAILWDLTTGRELQRLRGHTDAVASVALSPDGTKALTGGNDGNLILWDLKTGQEIRRQKSSRTCCWQFSDCGPPSGFSFTPAGIFRTICAFTSTVFGYCGHNWFTGR
jgi:WD40 repeat protein